MRLLGGTSGEKNNNYDLTESGESAPPVRLKADMDRIANLAAYDAPEVDNRIKGYEVVEAIRKMRDAGSL